MINASVGFEVRASTTNAGTSVVMRHAHIGTFQCSNPFIISEPA